MNIKIILKLYVKIINVILLMAESQFFVLSVFGPTLGYLR